MMSVNKINSFVACSTNTNYIKYQIENEVILLQDCGVYNQSNDLIQNKINTSKNINNQITLIQSENESRASVQVKNGNIKQDVARKRWQLLAKALNKSTEESSSEPPSPDELVSVRRFTSFDIITSHSAPDDADDVTASWRCYCAEASSRKFSVVVRHPNRVVTAEDLIGFNNTGNICVWPSEEALACCVLEDLEAFRDKWVLELGGGMSCLAGLMIGKYGNVAGLHLTDGNIISVNNVRRIVGRNDFDCFVKCSALKWQDVEERRQEERLKYDYVICADCVFFDEARDALIDTIWFYLSQNGVALVMAPMRGDTLKLFKMAALDRGFMCSQTFCYNDQIWERHLALKETKDYDENIHYPILLKLTKPECIE